MNILENKPSVILECLKYAFEFNEPILMTGPPGVGKTSLVYQAAESVQYPVYVAHPVVSEPIDFKGMPTVIDGIATFLPFDDLRILIDATEPIVFFIDDLGQAPASVQAAVMQLLLARRIGEKKVSEHVRFVAATNRREDLAGVQGILSPVQSRFTILSLGVSKDDWIVWAIKNDISPEMISFINYTGGKFLTEDRSHDIENTGNPRTVAKADTHFRNAPANIRDTLIAGAAGQAFMLEFTTYIKVFTDLPTLEDIVSDPENTPIPDAPSKLFVVVAMLITRTTIENTNAVSAYILRLTDDWQIRYLKLLSVAMTQLLPDIISAENVETLFSKHSEIIAEMSAR